MCGVGRVREAWLDECASELYWYLCSNSRNKNGAEMQDVGVDSAITKT